MKVGRGAEGEDVGTTDIKGATVAGDLDVEELCGELPLATFTVYGNGTERTKLLSRPDWYGTPTSSLASLCQLQAAHPKLKLIPSGFADCGIASRAASWVSVSCKPGGRTRAAHSAGRPRTRAARGVEETRILR